MIHLHKNILQNYYHLFDNTTGMAVRWKNDGGNPFWKEDAPELLDISITDYCEKGCDFCYRKANIEGNFMDLSLFEDIIRQAERAGIQQIALGGGNPNQHPEFIRFLKIAREHHIVASYTTNGQGMSEEIYKATKMFGGAIAASWYAPYTDALEVMEKCRIYNICFNIHFVLHKESLFEALALLNSDTLPWENINAIIFLNYKPLGRKIFNVLEEDENWDNFLNVAMKFKKCKIGFDSCMISWLMKSKELIAEESIDFCEAGRFSAFISEKGFMYPCSFLCGEVKYGENLKEKSMVEIWKKGRAFVEMRELLSRPSNQKTPILGCKNCANYELCRGGCQVFEINRCK